jgi:outer membrane protein, heavy metal efflux system
MSSKSVLIIAICGLVTHKLRAEFYTLSISQIQQRAERQSLAIRAQRAEVVIAGSEVKTAGLWENPEFSAQYDYQALTPSVANNPATVDLRLNQPLQLFGLRAARIERARAGVHQAGFQSADFERNFVLQVRLTAFKVLVLTNALNFQKAFYENYQKLLQANAFRYRKGDISEYELKKLEVEGTRYENSIAAIEIELTRRMHDLKKALSLTDADTLNINDDIKQPAAEEVNAIVSRPLDLERRPDLLAARNEITLAERSLIVLEKENLPDFSLATQYHYEPRSSLFAPNHYFGMGITVPLKIFNRNQGRRESYEQTIEKKKLTFEQELLNARNEIAAQRNAIKQYLTVLENALSKDMYEKGRLLYTKKAANLIQLLESERSYFEMQREYFEILYNFQESLEIYQALAKTVESEQFKP